MRRSEPLRTLLALLLLGACVPVEDGPPSFEGVTTHLLDEDLVNVVVEMRNPVDRAQVEAYARCAAARYTLIRGYGFARHVRTLVEERSGNWRADAVYTISPGLPQGLRTIDAEVTVAQCEQSGIPTV